MAKFAGKVILGCVLITILVMTLFSLWADKSERGGPVALQEDNDRTRHRQELMAQSDSVRARLQKSRADAAHSLGKHMVLPGGIAPPEGIHVEHPDGVIPSDPIVLDPQVLNVSKRENVTSDRKHPAASHGVFSMPLMTGQNVVSMSLYGSNRRYTVGAIRNAELIRENFPGWTLRIYTGSPSDARHEAIPEDVMRSLRALGADVYFMEHREDFIPPMMWRFLVADDLWVDRFIVRDSDARLTRRDAAAVYAWVQSDAPFTCVRDHPSHAGFAISGGLWGGKPQALRNVLRRSWRDLMRGVGGQYLQDMNFLETVIWPRVQNHSYCLDSVSCDKWPRAFPFPVPRYGYEHVGQVVNDHDLGRPQDLQILRNAPVNTDCVPPPPPPDT